MAIVACNRGIASHHIGQYLRAISCFAIVNGLWFNPFSPQAMTMKVFAIEKELPDTQSAQDTLKPDFS